MNATLLLCRIVGLAVFGAVAIIPVSADTGFSIYPNTAVLGSSVSFYDYGRLESKVSQYPVGFFDRSSDALGYGAAYSNIFGYPGGRPMIGMFPHIEFGFTTGAGVYRLDRYKDMNRNNLESPGAGGNAVLHFGTGLSPDSDITVKLMLNPGFRISALDRSKSSSGRTYDFEWRKMDIFSTGAKWRTYILRGQDNPSWTASFNGITFGLAGDYMHVKAVGRGTYVDNRGISFSITDLGTGTEKISVPVETTVRGKASTGWDVASLTPEVMVHANLLYVLGVYTGPSVSLNAGKVYVSSRTTGSMVNKSDIYDASGTVKLVDANSTVATAQMNVQEYIYVPAVIPRWVVGFELNFWKVKMQIETADVLTHPVSSFTAQAGLRVEL